ncbi:hypothetical protein ACP3V5_17570 [Vibrio maritimus]
MINRDSKRSDELKRCSLRYAMVSATCALLFVLFLEYKHVWLAVTSAAICLHCFYNQLRIRHFEVGRQEYAQKLKLPVATHNKRDVQDD